MAPEPTSNTRLSSPRSMRFISQPQLTAATQPQPLPPACVSCSWKNRDVPQSTSFSGGRGRPRSRKSCRRISRPIQPRSPVAMRSKPSADAPVSSRWASMADSTAGAMAAPMWLASLTLGSTTRPSVPDVMHRPGRSPASSSTQPAAVAVHCAEGGRCVPISKGKRNWRSAVQKWLDAAQSAFCR